MAVTDIVLLDPRHHTFMVWSTRAFEELAEYNVPRPVNESSWVDWASEVCRIDDIVALSPPDPRMFNTWQAWAINLQQVLN